MCLVRNVPGRTKTFRFRRGTKAGRKVIRHIHTVCNGWLRYEGHQLGVNRDNLVYIVDEILSNPSCSDEPCHDRPIPRRIKCIVNNRSEDALQALYQGWGVKHTNLIQIPTNVFQISVCVTNREIARCVPVHENCDGITRRECIASNLIKIAPNSLRPIAICPRPVLLYTLNCRSVRNK